MKNNTPITRKTWQEFRDTGLFFFVNTILHAFGWALVIKVDDETGVILECYPVRTIFRGFSNESQNEGYAKVSKYLKDNAEELDNEANINIE